jgi:hypothetical protein
MDKIPIDQIKGLNQGFLRKKKIFYRIKEWKKTFIRVKSESRIVLCLQKMEF